jgi:ABC-type uncharacterized transport system substrate-binding protein
MRKRAVFTALGLVGALLAGIPARAAGVFIVSHKGVEQFDSAKAGFIQMAYGAQLPGFNAKSIDLDGSAADDAALSALAAQNPSLVFTLGSQAAKRVRKAMPDVWIVYGMVYYPEAEGFTQDARMAGISSLGSTKALAGAVRIFTKSKALTVLHAQAESAAATAIQERLRVEGFDAQDRAVATAADLPAAFNAVKDQCKIVLLLPDGITSNPDSMRFLISQCVEAGILPVSLAEPLVASGALLASFVSPEAVGGQAARVAAEILKTGQPPADKLSSPTESGLALNKSTAQALKAQVPKNSRWEITYE